MDRHTLKIIFIFHVSGDSSGKVPRSI